MHLDTNICKIIDKTLDTLFKFENENAPLKY